MTTALTTATAYKIRHSHGQTDTIHEGGEEGYEDALAAVRAVYGADCEIGHDGDLADGGDRTMVWVDAETSQDDAGGHACASIVPVFAPEAQADA